MAQPPLPPPPAASAADASPRRIYMYNSTLACTNHRHDKDLYEPRLMAQLALSPQRTLRPEEASLFVHPACLVDAYFRAADGPVAGYWRAWRAIEALVLADIAALGFGHMPHAVSMLRCPAVVPSTRYWSGQRAYPELWWSGRFHTFGCLEAPGVVDASRAIHMPYCSPTPNPGRPPGVGGRAEPPPARDIRVLFIGSESGWGWNRRPALKLVNSTPGTHHVEVLTRTIGMRKTYQSFVPRQAELLQLIGRAVYTLCPRGDTPESSRIYQALAHGSIPLVEPYFHGPLHAGNWSEFSWPIKKARAGCHGEKQERAAERSVGCGGLLLPSAEEEARLQARLPTASAAFDCTPGSDAMGRFLRDAVARLDLRRPVAPVVPADWHARLRLFEPCRRLFSQELCGNNTLTTPQSCLDCLIATPGHLECRCVVNDTATLATWGRRGPGRRRRQR